MSALPENEHDSFVRGEKRKLGTLSIREEHHEHLKKGVLTQNASSRMPFTEKQRSGEPTEKVFQCGIKLHAASY